MYKLFLILSLFGIINSFSSPNKLVNEHVILNEYSAIIFKTEDLINKHATITDYKTYHSYGSVFFIIKLTTEDSKSLEKSGKLSESFYYLNFVKDFEMLRNDFADKKVTIKQFSMKRYVDHVDSQYYNNDQQGIVKVLNSRAVIRRVTYGMYGQVRFVFELESGEYVFEDIPFKSVRKDQGFFKFKNIQTQYLIDVEGIFHET